MQCSVLRRGDVILVSSVLSRLIYNCISSAQRWRLRLSVHCMIHYCIAPTCNNIMSSYIDVFQKNGYYGNANVNIATQSAYVVNKINVSLLNRKKTNCT